eukprot:g12401.t1
MSGDNARDEILGVPDERQWDYIIIHDSRGVAGGERELNAAWDLEYARQGLPTPRGAGYHFVINDREGQSDGEVEIARRWKDQQAGDYISGEQADKWNREAIGICLMGDADSRPFSQDQMDATVKLRFIDQAVAEYEVAKQIDSPLIRKVHKLIRQRALLRTSEVLVVMELVEGRTLETVKFKGMVGYCKLFHAAAKGLQVMHQAGYVHADIKPNNIMVTSDGMVKLIDFGQSCKNGTVKERIQGTPDYIAPEQVKRQPITPKTDLFNLGATMYWLLTGQRVPTMMPRKDRGETVQLRSEEAEKKALPTPIELVPECPPALSNLILECVAKDPADRPAHMQEEKLTDEQIGAAIDAIKDFLYKSQAADGGWYGAYHAGPKEPESKNNWGPTAMGALALIVAGESPQNPKIRKALEKLAEVEIVGVYALSMRAHVWSYLPQDIFGKLLLKDADTMLRSTYGKSRFNYPVAKPEESSVGDQKNRIDNSTTQYGVLALWQADKRGIKVPDRFWELAIENFLELQAPNGGWAYSSGRNTTQSMTLAGLTVMFVAQQELYRDKNKPDPKLTASIEKGLKFLNENFNVGDRVHGGVSYMWYGYERVGLASGIKYFGGKDWFQEIARRIVDRKANYGNSIHTAAFDLMFLARGRVPVWINKLQIPGTAWNNRPNDVYFLNRFISSYREHEVNWQVVGVESDPKDWISAPLMWISSGGEIALTDAQVNKLKTYLDLGGTIIANPEQNSSSFKNSIQELAKKLYPDLAFEPLSREHPMAMLLEGDPRGSRAPEVDILSNGARVLMILPRRDWGMTFQKDENPDPDKSEAWRDIVNIYGVVTDRGELTPRLSSPWVAKEKRPSTGSIKVFIPQWEDPAGKVSETDVYRVMKNVMHNATGKTLEVVSQPLTELAAASPALLHMMGVNAVSLSEAERNAVQAYVQAGGTILIENLGGKGEFATSIRDQLNPMFPGAEDPVSRRSDIITGRNLPDGSTSNRRVVFRRMVIELANPDGKLLLRGWEKDKRYPVLLSYEDLSLGMLGVKQYGISGYSIDSSRNLMINILLDAEKAQKAGGTARAE